jgi:endonuclease/exonuclease/phosphatase family metal-dependent hydrolase
VRKCRGKRKSVRPLRSRALPLRVLTWNLYHGRAVPGEGRSLLAEFAAALAGWEWDVALLQEVPPWWPPELARAAGAEQRTALTSRNALLPLRRWIADRFPDVIKSNGGGSNAILARAAIADHRSRRLRCWPERRVVHAVALETGLWAANLHATVHHPERAAADIELAARTALAWAGEAPLVLGGDFNVRDPQVDGFVRAGGHRVDHVLVRGLHAVGQAEVLDRGRLSDHAPVRVTLAGGGAEGSTGVERPD